MLKILCPHCNKTFSSEQARNQHIHEKHAEPKNSTCPVCNKKFKSPVSMIQHKKMVHDNQSEKKTSKNGGKSKEKAKNKNKNKEKVWIKCPYCIDLVAERDLEKHIAKTHGFECPHCSERVRSQEMLKVHITNKHLDKIFVSFICNKCKKSFKSEKLLTQHIQDSHNSSKIFYLQPKKEDKIAIKQRESLWEKFQISSQHRAERKRAKISSQRQGSKLSIFNLSKKVIIMDECVGNDTTVIDALGDTYDIRVLPKELKGKTDEHLRLIFEQKNWGVVSKDYEMVMNAKQMEIEPVFLIVEKQNHRDLIKISDGTYRLK